VLTLPAALAALLLGQAFAGWFASRCASAAHSEAPAQRRKLLERASRLQPESSEYALELGLARRDTGDLPGALRSLEQATALGGDVAAFVALGNVALEGNDVARARAAFESALARNPGSVRAHVGLGETLRRLGTIDAAERHTRVALELRPGDLELRARLDALHAQSMDRELDPDAPTESNLLGDPQDSR
jgi:tetratricopeptide (TPR) repeat protein